MKKEGIDYPQDKGQSAVDFLAELEERLKDDAEAGKYLSAILKKASGKEYGVEFLGGKSMVIKDERGKTVFFTDNPKRDLLPWIDGIGRTKGEKAFETGEGVVEEEDAAGDFLRNLDI